MPNEILIVVGMSGAGRSTAADVLEDLGWLVIDNLPSSLLEKIGDLALSSANDFKDIVLVLGRSGQSEYGEILTAIDDLKAKERSLKILYLDATDDILLRRFEGTRRKHPTPAGTLKDSIIRERENLVLLRARADIIIDSSDLNVHQFAEKLKSLFSDDRISGLQVQVVSFGFSYGIPVDSDLVMDVRFLPNPYWDESLKNLTGLNPEVSDFVLGSHQTKEFLEKFTSLLDVVIPGYKKENKSYLTIAIGCTGGKHRSVALAEHLAGYIKDKGLGVIVKHRDINKDRDITKDRDFNKDVS
jgi:UPF0042 nucleotide-binding protein